MHVKYIAEMRLYVNLSKTFEYLPRKRFQTIPFQFPVANSLLTGYQFTKFDANSIEVRATFPINKLHADLSVVRDNIRVLQFVFFALR